MKFIVSSTALLKQLQHLQGVISRKKTMPILDFFLFDVKGNKLAITASDMETTAVVSMPIESTAIGAVAVPAKFIVKALKVLPGQHIKVTVDKGHRMTLTSEQGTYEIKCIDAGEYPKGKELVDPTAYTLPASAMTNGIGKTLWATGDDDLRPVMSGIHVELKECETRFVATDAHCLVMHRYDKIHHAKPAAFILSKTSVKLLKALLGGTSGEVAMLVNETYVRFAFDNVVVICRVIDGKYPNYEAVFPNETPNLLTVERKHLLAGVRRMAVFSNKTTHQFRFDLKPANVTISAEDLDDDCKSSERLAGEYVGEPMQIGFNTRFLTEVLRNLNSEHVVIRMAAPNRAATILVPSAMGDEETLSLVMPVMLNN